MTEICLVCELEIDQTSAIRRDESENSYVFCSERCPLEFNEDPERYATWEKEEDESARPAAH